MSDERSIDELAAGYWAYVHLAERAPERNDHEGWSAAWDHLDRTGADGLGLIVALVDSARDDEDLARLGVDLLEDYVTEHGDEAVDELERLSRTDPRFHEAMRSVWIERGALTPEVEARLVPWVT